LRSRDTQGPQPAATQLLYTGKAVCNNKGHDSLLPDSPIGVGSTRASGTQVSALNCVQAAQERPEPDRDKTDF
jgi:hypothetical protein